MKSSEQVTRVAVGATDGYRYVGIQPPLTDNEARILGIELNPYNQITAVGKEATLLTVNGDAFQGGPRGRDQHALEVAKSIADTLKNLRSEQVMLWATPVQLRGHNSTPFSPLTD